MTTTHKFCDSDRVNVSAKFFFFLFILLFGTNAAVRIRLDERAENETHPRDNRRINNKCRKNEQTRSILFTIYNINFSC